MDIFIKKEDFLEKYNTLQENSVLIYIKEFDNEPVHDKIFYKI